MKIMIIEAKYLDEIIIPAEVLAKLPASVTLAVSIQYYDQLQPLQKQLENAGKKVALLHGFHSKYPGQIVGCDLVKTTQGSDAFLYIGDGLFHAKTLLLKSSGSVHCYFPSTAEYKLLTQLDVKNMLQREKGAKMRFYDAHSLGILVTTKYGQSNLKAAFAMQKYLAGRKNVTVFLTDILDWNDLENYPFVDMWINTMCPRISYDDQHKFNKPVLDLAVAFDLIAKDDKTFSFTGLLAAREH